MNVEGLGTELGLLNLFLLMVGAGSAAVLFNRIRLLMSTEWKKVLKQHNKMWAQYMKDRLESGDTGDYSELD